ncbi:CHAT domain-containing protein [Prosthecobacter sp.]|uniref:CHAT domain-containing protein n=1 Tax=Prosthecobacter sp. TaxID=1965333 RepID=UPI0037850E69
MRSITLEILRHGPPHNQLLSPLTPYLALCESHAATTVTVPFEHAQFLQRLRALSYELPDAIRVFQLEDTGREMGALLAKIPSLIAEISQCCTAGNGKLLHLRMIVSASELAQLPFELMISHNGFPGEGRALVLQTNQPVCLTREVRQSSCVSPEWNREGRRPRILFVAASPPGVDAVPLESHLLALRAAIDPWVFHPDDETKASDKIAEHLVVLPQATIEQIREQCATGGFSHVHILAHGLAKSDPTTGERSYGLALHDSRDPAGRNIVDGKTLARTLRTDRESSFAPADPLVVTLASCNAGTVGSVMSFAGAGASVAHALHAEGIPVVIASQFPLSFRGSVMMVETLYGGLLKGDDPRELMHDLRGQLHGAIPETHDWASLVLYAALPARFERQLASFKVDQAHWQVRAALNHVDWLITQGRGRKGTTETDAPGEEKKISPADEQEGEKRVEVAKRRLRDLAQCAKAEIDEAASPAPPKRDFEEWARARRHYSRISGFISAAEKRHSELVLKKHKVPGKRDSNRIKQMLVRSMDAYWDSFFYDRSKVWALVQHIYVQCILEPHLDGREAPLPSERSPELLWDTALNASLADLQAEGSLDQLWARDNLLELRLLHGHFKNKKIDVKNAASRQRKLEMSGSAREHIRAIRGITGGKGFDLYAIARQIDRFASDERVFSKSVRDEARGYADKLQPLG